jgi:hypothetical protein
VFGATSDLRWRMPRGPGPANRAMTRVEQVRGQRPGLDSVPESGRLPNGRYEGMAETANLVPNGYRRNRHAAPPGRSQRDRDPKANAVVMEGEARLSCSTDTDDSVISSGSDP